MTTSARIGYGVAFAIGDGGDPETFTDVAEVTSVTPPSLSMDTVAATHTDSEEGWREYIAGLLDDGAPHQAELARRRQLPHHLPRPDGLGVRRLLHRLRTGRAR